MQFVMGELIFILGIFYYGIAMAVARNPVKKGWTAHPLLFDNVNTINAFIIIGLFSSGIGYMWKIAATFHSRSELIGHLAVFLLLLAASIFFVKKFILEKRLAAYAALSKPLASEEETGPKESTYFPKAA